MVPTLQVPAQGCERWVESLGFPTNEGWRPWAVGGKVAGGVVEYAVPRVAPRSGHTGRSGLEYATVHGAGHGVPQHRPQAALAMLEAVLAGNELPRIRNWPRL
jgi:hypothetical protein